MQTDDFTQTLHAALVPTNPDSAAKKRIRRQLDSRLARGAKKRRIGSVLAAAAAASAASAATVLILQFGFSSEPTKPSVSVSHPIIEDTVEQDSRPAAEPPSIVHLASGARIFVSAGGRITTVRDSVDDVLIRVERGYAIFDVDKRDPSAKFIVAAGSVRAEVVGTTFAVGYRSDSRPSVIVYEGQVAVTDDNGRSMVGAGSRWPAGAPRLAVADAEVFRVMGTAKAATVASTKADRPKTAARAGTRTEGRAASRTRTASQFVQAQRIEKRGKIIAAARVYERLASQNGPHAGDALYALARIALRRSDANSARLHLAAYKERFSGGPYTQAVDVHLLNIHLSAKDDEAALSLSNHFLHTHSSDPRADKFRLVRASIQAKRGQCASAIEDVRTIQPSARTRQVRALCDVGGDALPQ